MDGASRGAGGRSEGGIPVRTSALGPREDQFSVLAEWLGELATPAAALLDIGSGDGDDEYGRLIRPLVGRYVGVDPDDRSERHPALDEWHHMTIESFASRLTPADGPHAPAGMPAGTLSPPVDRPDDAPGAPALFRVAIAVYVAEHVTDPVAFLSAARTCLEPGGSLFIITPNSRHYFGMAARLALTLRLDDRLLESLRRRQQAPNPGQHHSHDHAGHFPMSYKMNSVPALRNAAGLAGYTALEVRHLENPAIFETYFPGRLVVIPRTYARLVHRFRLKGAYGTLICRLVN